MRGWLGGWHALSRVVRAGLIGGPVAALVLASFLDRGPRGDLSPTPLYVALAIWEPLTRHAIANSLAVAIGVTSGSLVLGVGLAALATRRQFWGRAWVAALACGPLVVPPLFGAIGLAQLLERPGLSTGEPGGWGGWLALAWLGLAFGVPWVGRRAGAALSRVEPAQEAAARLAGAGRWRAWWRVTWPAIRPEAARAAAEVFTWSLIEPGAPWVLGLRRTLAFQAVQAALDPIALPRAAALALIGLALATLGRAAIRAWGRSPLLPPTRVVARPRRASWRSGAVLVSLGFAWLAFAWAPIVGVLVGAIGAGEADALGSEGTFPSLWNSAVLGLAAAVPGLILAIGLAARPSREEPARPRTVGDGAWGIPPLALGIGLLTIPRLLEMAASAFGDGEGGGAFILAARWLGRGLDPIPAPGLLLVWSAGVTYLPILTITAGEALGLCRPILVEAAITLGAPRRRAAWMVLGRPLVAALGGGLLLTAALAASESAASLILTPTSEGRTIGPAVANSLGDPGGRRRGARLASAALLVNLAALAIAARTRPSGGEDRP